MIGEVDIENDLFRLDDGTEFPLLRSEVTTDELNDIFEEAKNITKEIYNKYYGETDES